MPAAKPHSKRYSDTIWHLATLATCLAFNFFPKLFLLLPPEYKVEFGPGGGRSYGRTFLLLSFFSFLFLFSLELNFFRKRFYRHLLAIWSCRSTPLSFFWRKRKEVRSYIELDEVGTLSIKELHAAYFFFFPSLTYEIIANFVYLFSSHWTTKISFIDLHN
jgi:hypothetical protein